MLEVMLHLQLKIKKKSVSIYLISVVCFLAEMDKKKYENQK